ncbi:HesA/MoeB/ThiF family protein [Sorangium sp. So ce590]|uniref:HesA/MoeB/ThiF family protein n=1 Tax=unclassified Sorangium TaxID=2621164 RepID=UPI003F61ACA2
MTSTTVLPPPAIERGLRGLCAVVACSVEDGPKFDEKAKRWVVRLVLRRDAGAEFVAAATRWCVLLDDTYPFGRVSFYPASEGGLTATFPHQSRNAPGRDRRAWRDGRLCLDTPFGGERRVVVVRDPVGDADQRLRWHTERALQWLHRAANDQLLAAGDPFELPDRPHTTARGWIRERVVHDESAASFAAWDGRAGSFGIARFGALKDIGNVLTIKSFEDQSGDVVRAWSGRELGDLAQERRVNGFWWLWPQPVVVRPWQAPGTWRDLRRIAKAMNIDVDAMLRWLFPQLRGSKSSGILMLGYPMPARVGEDANEVHWDALLLPRLEKAEGQPHGFRPNARGWWHRDRYGKFADTVALEYLFTDNWSGDRLQARGRLPRAVRDCNVAVIGVGALGSVLSELLVRAGVKNIALIDEDVVESGNVNRHVATLVDVGKSKVPVVAQRLRQISPTIRVAEFSEKLPSDAKAIETQLDEYDIIIDCTSSDMVLSTLERAWWSIPRTFASFSMGFGGKRLFSFGVSGNRFPQGDFARNVRPWLEHESKAWADNDEVFEGAGCWSPLFPARCDDVVLAAAVCVKELETVVAKRPTAPRFRVFAQSSSDDGFQGFAPESAPPALEALAS